MNRKQKQYSFRPPVVGGSSLLVMFCVLCLTTFAVLSLSTVRAGDRLAEASMEAVQEYYEADQEAERMLAKLRSGEIPEGEVLPTDQNRYVPNQPYEVDDTFTAQTEIPTYDAYGNQLIHVKAIEW